MEANITMIDKGIIALQEKLQLPQDFFKNLLEEDDWSFVIKLHALIEAACGSLLLHHLQEPGLEKIISRLELSNKTLGKIAFLKELELLSSANRRYISSLSELRNGFVHNVQNCNSKLYEMISGMDKKNIKKFALDFSPLELTLKIFENSKLELLDSKRKEAISDDRLIERALKNPKFHIWLGAYNLLSSIVDMEGYSDYLKYEKARRFLYERDDEEDLE